MLIPSKWEETFGRVAIEGMANGIPTIGSNIGGLKETIGNGGIVIKNYLDVDRWIKEIKRLKKRENYNLISKRGIKWVEQSYSLNQIIQKAFLFLEYTLGNFKKESIQDKGK